MRFMMLMIPKGYEKAAPGTMPSREMVEAIRPRQGRASVAWALRCPAQDGDVIEVRQVQEMADFPADVREAAAGLPELRAASGQRKGS